MIITTAKQQENGVLLNGSVSLPDSNTGHVQDAYQAWLAAGNTPEPQYSAEDIILTNKTDARSLRDSAVVGDLFSLGVYWQVTEDAQSIRNVLSDGMLIGASAEETLEFRLADDSWRTTTHEELQQVMEAYVARKRNIWEQFNTWCLGSCEEPFEVV